MAATNFREVMCKVGIKTNDLSVDRESGAVTFLYDQETTNKGKDLYLKLFQCIGKISKNREREGLEEGFDHFILDSNSLTQKIFPNEYFEVLYQCESDIFGSIKKNACNELFISFFILKNSMDDLKNILRNQNQMTDNSAYEGAGESCIKVVYDSLIVLHSLSKGLPFIIEVEGHDKIEMYIPEIPPKPISKLEIESIELNEYRVKGADYDLYQLTVISRDEKVKKDVLLNQEDFEIFHIEFVKDFLSGNLFFDFVVQEDIGNKFNLISFSKHVGPQEEIDC